MTFLPDVRHCGYCVLAEIWASDLSHKTGNKLCIDLYQGWKEGSFVWNRLIFLWANTHPFDLKFVALCLKFRIFQNFSRKLRLSSTKTCEISPYFLQFLFCVRIALKKFTQVLSYVVCAQARRHVHKGITKRIYGEEKPGRFVFGKQVSFTLGLGLTTPYSLCVLVSNFY